MLPKGDLTRDQLSQLLLVYIGTPIVATYFQLLLTETCFD